MKKDKKYINKEIKEILGDENKWFTGEKVGHSPSADEMALHYVLSGGAEDFERRQK